MCILLTDSKVMSFRCYKLILLHYSSYSGVSIEPLTDSQLQRSYDWLKLNSIFCTEYDFAMFKELHKQPVE